MMSMIETIDKALVCLGKTAWKEPIDQLLQHFDGLPYDHELDDIKVELADILWKLVDTYKEDPEAPIDRFFAIRLSRLTCWSYHAHNSHPEDAKFREYWNPLEIAYRDFTSSKTNVVRSGTSYPADDMIKHWSITRCA
jgi:hypothetical protein